MNERGNPTVSVLVAAYNAAPYIEEALASIAAQEVAGTEVIVADDHSKDDTREIATAFDSLDLEVVTGPHVGIGQNLARAADRCSGEYVAMVAADDRWRPGHLNAALEAFKDDREASLTFSLTGRIDPDGRRITPPPTLKRRRPRSGWVNPEEVLRSNFIEPWGVVMRGAAFREVGGLDPQMDLVEWELLMRLVTWGPVIHIPTTTVDYRVHPGGVSNSSEFVLQGRIQVYRKHVPDPQAQKRLIGQAYMRAAYPNLWPAPTSESVKRARSLLHAAFRTWHGIVGERRFLPLLASAYAGRLYIRSVRKFGDRFRTARVKLRMQRILGMAK